MVVRDTPVAGLGEFTALLLGTFSLAIHVPPLMPEAALLTYWNLSTRPMLLLQAVLLARFRMGVRVEPDTAPRRIDLTRLANARDLTPQT